MAALTTSAAPENVEIVAPDFASLPPDFCLSNCFLPAPLGLWDLFRDAEVSSSSEEDGGLWYASGRLRGLLDCFLCEVFFNLSPNLGSDSFTSFFLCFSSFEAASFLSLFLLFFMFFWLTDSEMVELSLIAFWYEDCLFLYAGSDRDFDLSDWLSTAFWYESWRFLNLGSFLLSSLMLVLGETLETAFWYESWRTVFLFVLLPFCCSLDPTLGSREAVPIACKYEFCLFFHSSEDLLPPSGCWLMASL